MQKDVPFSSVIKGELLHTTFDLKPVFAFQTEQWPEYDPVIYESIVWDREYSLNAAITFDLTFEIAHAAYYRLTGTFTFFKAGFGMKDILFEESPYHYCTLFYFDRRAFQTSLAFETNSKVCQRQLSFIDEFSLHWDSRDPRTELM